MGLKGVVLAIFTFAGAIIMTLVAIWIITIDAQWHLGQVIQQAFSLDSLNLLYDSDPLTRIPWLDFPLQTILIMTILIYGPDLEHALYGQSPSSYVLWFVGFLFLFMILAGIAGLITDKTDMDPLKVTGFGAFVIAGAVVTTFIAVFFVTADAQFHLRAEATQMFLIGGLSGNPMQDLVQLFAAVAFTNWSIFEHAVGQSASSYVLWFILFIIIYPFVAGILVWIAKRR